MSSKNLFLFDSKYKGQNKLILGIDEVGRGCCAGPLVVAGVILKDDFYCNQIKDSKKIKDINKREQLTTLILKNSISCRIKIFSPQEVDFLNPKYASIKGMNLIAKILNNKYDYVFTDYEKINSAKNINITKGDNVSYVIACASIVAKSCRDKIMNRINFDYPNYDFVSNQGYCTKKHSEILKKYGAIEKVHRYSYKNIKSLTKK